MQSDNRITTAERRKFLFDAAKSACAVGVLGLGLSFYARQATALPPIAIRPPGALDENDFLGACVRCGLCVRDCPYGILDLARLEHDVAVGTPYFVARTGPCEMCEQIHCVKACPSGALDPGLTDVTRARMGLAALVDQETCLNFLGIRCDVCYRACPLMGKAITLEPRANVRTAGYAMFIPTVHSDACTGCGKCENACVLETAAIRVYPRSLVKGEPGERYRLRPGGRTKSDRSSIEGRAERGWPARFMEKPR